RPVALHPHRRNEDMQVAEAAADDVEDVADGRAGWRRDDADHSREGREQPLAPLVEEAFRLELPLELLESELERAEALGLHHLDDQLVLTPRGVDVEAAEDQHLLAVLEVEAHPPAAAAEEDGRELRALVLEREVRVAGAWRAQVRDLPLDPHGRKRLLERHLQAQSQLRNRINLPLAHRPLTLPSPGIPLPRWGRGY